MTNSDWESDGKGDGKGDGFYTQNNKYTYEINISKVNKKKHSPTNFCQVEL